MIRHPATLDELLQSLKDVPDDLLLANDQESITITSPEDQASYGHSTTVNYAETDSAKKRTPNPRQLKELDCSWLGASESGNDLSAVQQHNVTKMTDDLLGSGMPSTSSLLNITSSSPTPAVVEPEYICKWVLYHEIPGSRVRMWDLCILVPNVIFLLFMALHFNRARLKLRTTSSPIFSTFYILVSLNAVMSVIRCVVSMTVNAAAPAGGIADKALWVAVRFFLLSTEMSVLIFGLAFGHLDSRTSIQRVLVVTSFVALLYSGTQGVLELVLPDRKFYVPDKNFELFGHGGMLFWFISSVLFAVVYIIVFLLPWTGLRERVALPAKQSFYWYALFLAVLNLTQAVGSGLYYYDVREGVCVVDVTSYLYFTIFTPLVYKTFLADFFSISQPSIMFSYKAQTDDPMEDDNVSLPHQLSCSSLKTDSDYIYQNNSLYDSTHFDAANVNPLYAQSLQSPDSVVDYCGASQRPTYQTSIAPSQQPPPR